MSPNDSQTGDVVPPRRRPETMLALLRRFSRLWGFLLFLIFVVVLFRGIVLPFVFAIVIAYLLAPVVRRAEPHIGRPLAVISAYLVIIAVLAAFFGLLLPNVVQDLARLRDSAPAAVEKFNQEWIPRASKWIDQTFSDLSGAEHAEGQVPPELIMTPLGDGSYRIDLEGARLMVQETGEGSWLIGPPTDGRDEVGQNLRALVATEGAQLTSSIGPWIQAFIAGVAGFVTSLVITFMLAAFILVDLGKVNNFLRSLIPYEYRLDYDELMARMDTGLAGVIRGQLLICLVNGVLTYIGLIIFGIKYSFLLALLAAVFSLIPIFGTIISSIPIVVVALVSGTEGLSLGPAIGILAWIAGIHLLEANIFNPKIIGDSAHIHPVVVIFALLAGQHVYGLVGALLAVPVASIVQTVFLHARSHSSVFAREPREAKG